jgi:hypothetical protein
LWLLDEALSEKKEKTKSPDYYQWYPWRPWYPDEVSKELISFTEELLIPETAQLPDIPNPIIITKLRRIDWQDTEYIFNDSQPVGMFTTNTKITKDKSIVTRVIEEIRRILKLSAIRY